MIMFCKILSEAMWEVETTERFWDTVGCNTRRVNVFGKWSLLGLMALLHLLCLKFLSLPKCYLTSEKVWKLHGIKKKLTVVFHEFPFIPKSKQRSLVVRWHVVRNTLPKHRGNIPYFVCIESEAGYREKDNIKIALWAIGKSCCK